MKLFYITFVLIVGIALVAGCQEKAAQGGRKKGGNEIGKDFLLTMERTSCRGNCPGFHFTIDAAGNVSYTGKRNVKNIGSYTKKLPSAQLTELNQAIQTADFFALQDKYDNENIADLPTCTISYTNNGKSKTVSNRRGGPQSLVDLEKKIESIVGEEGFTPSK